MGGGKSSKGRGGKSGAPRLDKSLKCSHTRRFKRFERSSHTRRWTSLRRWKVTFSVVYPLFKRHTFRFLCFILCVLIYGGVAIMGYLMFGEAILSQITSARTSHNMLQKQRFHTSYPYIWRNLSASKQACRSYNTVVQAGLLKEGLCSVHDESVGLIVSVVKPQPGERIMDACAAPGGKTLFMASCLKGQGIMKWCVPKDQANLCTYISSGFNGVSFTSDNHVDVFGKGRLGVFYDVTTTRIS